MDLRAKDLFYEKSADYHTNGKIDIYLKEKYLTSKKNKIELLDNSIDLNEGWRSTLINENLLDELLNPIHRGYTFSKKRKWHFCY